MANRDNSDPYGLGCTPGWAWSWPANRRILYNRASADPSGKPWDPKRALLHWNGKKWAGMDVANYGQAAPGSNVGPFIMHPEGVARLFSIDKMNDGPFPEHYEPIESPIGTNPLHPDVVSSPVAHIYHDDTGFGQTAGNQFRVQIVAQRSQRVTQRIVTGYQIKSLSNVHKKSGNG